MISPKRIFGRNLSLDENGRVEMKRTLHLLEKKRRERVHLRKTKVKEHLHKTKRKRNTKAKLLRCYLLCSVGRDSLNEMNPD